MYKLTFKELNECQRMAKRLAKCLEKQGCDLVEGHLTIESVHFIKRITVEVSFNGYVDVVKVRGRIECLPIAESYEDTYSWQLD